MLQVMAEARVRAEHEPLTLSKSWGAAVLMLTAWDGLLLLLVAWCFRYGMSPCKSTYLYRREWELPGTSVYAYVDDTALSGLVASH